MPVVNFGKRYFLGLLGAKLTDKQLVSHISALGFNVEGITADQIEIEVTSNRPDLLTAVGFARALRCFIHRPRKLSYSLSGNDVLIEIKVGKRAGRVRPYISGLVATGLKLDNQSLTSLINGIEKFCETYGRNRRKIAVGMHDLSSLAEPYLLEYDAYNDEQFVPLNSSAKASFSEIMAKNEKGVRYGSTISAGEQGYPALKDSKGTLSLIPIINSERTRVTSSTKDLFVDITGTSQYWVEKSADLLASIFIEMGAQIRPVRVDYGKAARVLPRMEKEEFIVPLQKIEGAIGVRIGPNNVASLAEKMGYEVSYIGTKVKFRVPPYRLDVINEQDIIEDVAIGYGYDYIRPVAIKSGDPGALEGMTMTRERLVESMLGLGFTEMMNSYLSNEEMNFSKMRVYKGKDYVRIKNAKSESATMLRTWLLPSLARNIGISQHEKMPQRAFELDMAFEIAEGIVVESYHLAAISADAKANFNDIKSTFAALAEMFRLDCSIEAYDHASFIEGRCAKIVVANKTVGFFGELHPEVLRSFGIEEPAVAMEIDLAFMKS